MMEVVSACLAGVACRYDGTAQAEPEVVEAVRQGKALPLCPEMLGGLPAPREAAEIKAGRVVTATNVDLTEAFQKGAEIATQIAILAGCRKAVLKARSPSCGCGQIYDGSFSGRLVEGDGLWAQALKQAGMEVSVR